MSEIKLGFWENLRNGIRQRLINENIKNFQSWGEIQSTMIAGVHNAEYEYLIVDEKWSQWKDKLNETILKPNSHVIHSKSSTNNLHHAYSLQILMENTGYKLFEFNDIIEFGGGYGNMCRLFKVWGHKDLYYLYDIPELSQIQRYYLTENGITSDVLYKTELDIIENVQGNSLFLALWSISEVPIGERARLLENLKFFECKNIFIAMGGIFQSENNLKWLNDIIIPKLNLLKYSYKLIKIAHGTDMFYFIATKNSK